MKWEEDRNRCTDTCVNFLRGPWKGLPLHSYFHGRSVSGSNFSLGPPASFVGSISDGHKLLLLPEATENPLI